MQSTHCDQMKLAAFSADLKNIFSNEMKEVIEIEHWFPAQKEDRDRVVLMKRLKWIKDWVRIDQLIGIYWDPMKENNMFSILSAMRVKLSNKATLIQSLVHLAVFLAL